MTVRLALIVFILTGGLVQAQTLPPGEVKIHEIGKDGLKIAGKLAKSDPPLALLKGAPHQVFPVKMQKGQQYIIDLASDDFDAFLFLVDAAGKVLAHDDDSGGGLNSRIAFRAKTDGVYRVLASALDHKPGAFQLKIRAGEISEEEKQVADAARLNAEGEQLYRQGRHLQAVVKMRQGLEIRQGLFSAAKFPDGHPDLALSLNNVGFALLAVGSPEQTLDYYQQSLAMRQRLYPVAKYPDGHGDLAQSLNNLGAVRAALGSFEKAVEAYEQALAMNRRLYPVAKHPEGHQELATNLNNLGAVLIQIGSIEKASVHFEQALAMTRAIYPPAQFPGGHSELAQSLSNYGSVLFQLGAYDKALVQFEQGLAMRQKIFPAAEYPEGHPEVAESLHNLAHVLLTMGSHKKALRVFETSLAMQEALYPRAKFRNGHSDLARSLNSLGLVHRSMGSLENALALHERALAMHQLLYPPTQFPDGHAEQTISLNNMGAVHRALGALDKASEFYDKALTMNRTLYPASKYPDGHPHLAFALLNQGEVLFRMEAVNKALDHFEQALAMTQRLVDREILTASEARALTQIDVLRKGLSDLYYSTAVSAPATPESSYRVAWDEKGAVQRLLSRRHLAAAVQRHESAALRQQYEQLGQIRREIARLVNQAGKDIVARDKRLAELSDDQDRLERALAKQIPAVNRARDLANLQPKDLVAGLPAQTVLVDFVRYTHSSTTKESGKRYLAFVMAAGQPIRRIELGDADAIDRAVTAWRTAIASRQASPAPSSLRELLWGKLAAHIPVGTKTIYVAPDGDLTRLSWAALPIGDAKVLLDDYAVAIVPHGPFLLEHLKYPRSFGDAATMLALGDVAYRSKTWPDLPGTAVELKSLPAKAAVTLTGSNATEARLLAELPKARYAHLATHGFFDVETLTAEKKRAEQAAKSRQFGDETRHVAVRNPLGFVGLVLADGEVLTGLSLVDLPLENLKLITLSACETGLGQYTGGEGVQGLQRAFHIAGCPNVVASLWNVNDAATAALMTKFYHELWVNKKPPIEALREAQLTIYRHPELIPDLAGERGAPKLKEAVTIKASVEASARRATADTKLWAAFVLSGIGK